MTLLLDTHIWIWGALEPRRLSKKVAAALESPKNELWLSPISVWELLILVEKKRVELDRPAARWAVDVCSAVGLRGAVLTRDIAIQSREIAFPTRTPPIASWSPPPSSTN